MVLSKRERYVSIAAMTVVVILGLDQLVIGPLLQRKAEVDDKIAAAEQQYNLDRRMLAHSRQMSQRWDEMVRRGLGSDASTAESRVLNRIREWAQEAGMTLSSVKPERTEKDKDFVRVTFRASGSGGMSQISRFLWQIQTASVPVRVVDLQVSTKKDGTDDLGLVMGIATSYLAPPTRTDKQPTAGLHREYQP